MKKILFAFLIFISNMVPAQTLQQLNAKRITLPNGWSLTPVGRSFPLGDLPLNIAVSSSKKYLAVTNNGYGRQYVQLIDVRNEKTLDSVVVPRSWLGLKFSADEKYLYAAAGNNNMILKFIIRNNRLTLSDSIILGKKWPNKIWPTGIEIDDMHKLLYVVTKENNSLYVIGLKDKKILHEFHLPGEGYTCILSPDKAMLYISCWGCDKVLLYDAQAHKFSGEIKVGDNPNDMCMTKGGNYLFVANSNDNSVSVIDTHQQKVIETLNCALYPNAPTGSTTNGVSLSEDGRTLYIANADNNSLSVFDVSNPGRSVSKGFIPVGWYPTCVRVAGKKVFVSNGKGFNSMANPDGPQPINRKQTVTYQKGDTTAKPAEVQYIGGLFKGTMTVFNEPDTKAMSVYTAAVYRNTPYNTKKEETANGQKDNPVPTKAHQSSPIKHVFYIIKENRTYDQVLGDMKEGNGDENLCLFPEKITPNEHAIAREFILLDNFYDDAEVSADGHNWSNAAYSTDFVEKSWPTNYGGKGGTYDFEGQKSIAYPKKGFIWDHLNRAGVSFRTYGEFADNGLPNIPVLKNHLCPYFAGFTLSIRDTVRYNAWQREFDSLLANSAVPQYNSIRLGNDHTEGVRKGKPTPFAHVADNDLAFGMLLDHLSHSSIWKESVVFVLEDDAQNGPDHVDAHRSIAFVAGGLVKRHYADHTMYSTSSMLRTIELILGIPPMSQYDAAAEPMWRCFTNKPDLTPYTARPSNVDLSDKNTVVNELSEKSEKFNFAKADAIDDFQFTDVLWRAIKGINSKVPSPTRGAFLKFEKKKDED